MKKMLVLIMFLFITVGTSLFAQDSALYSLQEKISVPGNGGYDYLSIDNENHHLFVSHGTSVDVIDINTNKVIDSIDGMQGVHGIAVVNEVNKGFITDGKGNAVVVFDLKTFKKIKTIPVTGKGPDAVAYDPFSKKVFTFCGDSNDACVIDIHSLQETTTVALGGAPEFGVSDGNGLLYNNLEDKSSLDVIDTKTMKVIHTYPLAPCGGPTGLAIDKKDKRVFTVCRENKGMSVVDMNTGKVTTTVPIGAGVDAVAYDASTKIIIVSNADGTATIIRQKSADDYQVVQTLSTTYRAKTMALNEATHTIYLSAPQFISGTRNIVPGTFTVYVYKLKHP